MKLTFKFFIFISTLNFVIFEFKRISQKVVDVVLMEENLSKNIDKELNQDYQRINQEIEIERILKSCILNFICIVCYLILIL